MELIRRALRGAIGYQSHAYILGAKYLSLYYIIRREGWRTMSRLEKIKEGRGSEVLLSLRSLRQPIAVRPGTDDVPSIINNVIREEYGQFAQDFSPNVIVDVGAYIGDTTAYFLSRFPSSFVIALEPNEESSQLASRNLKGYGERVVLLAMALWSESTTMLLGGAQTGAAIGKSGREVSTTTIPDLMRKFSVSRIDLLKLDIEGSESEVIPSGVGDWLDRVEWILLETHGNDIEYALIPLLSSNGFSCKRFRNVWYCKRRANVDTRMEHSGI